MKRNVKMDSACEKEYVRCNLCGADKPALLYCAVDTRYKTTPRDKFHVVKCSRCGLIYVNPRPTSSTITEFYPSQFYNFRISGYEKSRLNATGKDARLVLEQLYQKYMQLWKTAKLHEKVKRVEHVVGRKGKILDIGFAAGHFLGIMKERGWEAYGVEVSKEMCDFARKTYDLHVTCGDLFNASYPDNFFDVVTLWAVLAHLHDPQSTLIEIARILKKDGIVVFSSSNAESIDDYFFKDRFDLPRHLYHFSPRTLKLMVKRANLEVKQISHFTLTATSKVESRLTSMFTLSKNDTLIKKIAYSFWREGTRFLGLGISCIFALLRHGHTIVVVGAKES